MKQREKDTPISEAARKARSEYARNWRKKNPDKVRANIARYWERKARAAADQTAAQDHPQTVTN